MFRSVARFLFGGLQPEPTFAQRVYRSRRWAHVRYNAFVNNRRRYGRTTCEICRRTEKDRVKFNADHIKNVRDHPELAYAPWNVQILCQDCNKGKGNKNHDWRRG